MYDDGLHGDGLAGDGIYGGTIQPYSHGSIVEFYIWAEATGGSNKFPASATVNNCLYVVQNDPTPDSNLTIFRFVLTDENWNWLANHPYSDTPLDCTFIFGDRAYYNSGVRFRGGSRDWSKHSYKVHMPAGYRFRGADRFDLNFEKNDKTLLKSQIIYHLLDHLALPGAKTEFIHTRWRNTYAGVHLYTEARCGDYLENYFPEDADGNLYKAIAPWDTNTAWDEPHYTGSPMYEKQTNEELDDWSDFIELGDITSYEPNTTYEAEVRRVVDVANWGRSFAVLCVGCLIDTPWYFHNQNYRLYRRFSDDRFVHILHDFDDAYWGTMYDNAGPFVSWFPDTARFLAWPSFTREYYHGLWRAINLTDGVYREARIEPEAAYYHHLIFDDVAVDPFSGSSLDNRWNEFQNSIPQWHEWLTARNGLLRGWLPSPAALAITAPAGPTFVTGSPDLTLEGTAPLSAPRLSINWVEEDDIRWDSVTEWRWDCVLEYHTNRFVVRTLDYAGNEIEQVSIDVVYTAGMGDIADFVTGPLPAYPPLTVQFYDQSHASNITAWDWDFGDDTTGNGPNPVHTYADGWNAYDVTLTITADGGPYSTTRSITVGTPPPPPPPVPGDFDGDYDVDQEDFGRLQACLSGPGSPQTAPACAKALLDGDDDVDQDDLAIFFNCVSGPNVPGNPRCN